MHELVQEYVIEKYKQKIWMRENAEAYTYAKGRLGGACMALELSYEETKAEVIVFTQSKKKVITRFDKTGYEEE